jgi:hypothetical protein
MLDDGEVWNDTCRVVPFTKDRITMESTSKKAKKPSLKRSVSDSNEEKNTNKKPKPNAPKDDEDASSQEY